MILDPNIRTSRLILRTPRVQDAAGLSVLFSNPRSTEFEPHKPSSTTEEDYAKAIPRWDESRQAGAAAFMVIIKPGDDGHEEVIGMGGINGISAATESGERVADVGVCINSPEWRRGYGREALSATIDYALHEANCQSIVMETFFANKAFQALAGGMGLEQYKTVTNGGTECLYRFGREEWTRAKRDI